MVFCASVDYKQIYFAAKANSSSSENQKIHEANRDSDHQNEKSRVWSILEIFADTYKNYKAAFLSGFFMAIIACYIAIMNDSHDRVGLEDYVRSTNDRECRDMDKTMGYEKSLQKERERNPQLYDA